MIRAALAVALACAAVATTAPARADGPTQPDDRAVAKAKKLYGEGEKLFALGKFAAALGKYEAAFEITARPKLLFNIGQCHRNLGDYNAAIFSFRKYLKLLPEADNREAVLDYIDELEQEKQNAEANNLTVRPHQGDDTTGGTGVVTGPTGPIDQPPGGKPIYKKWWFWGGVAVVGAGVIGTAVVLSGGGGPPDTDLGNIDFGK